MTETGIAGLKFWECSTRGRCRAVVHSHTIVTSAWLTLYSAGLQVLSGLYSFIAVAIASVRVPKSFW